MLKESIFAILTRFVCAHLPFIIINYKCLCYFMQLYNRPIAKLPAFSKSCDLE